MLKHITWQEFLLATALLTFLWYIAVFLLLFRKELKNLLKGKILQKPIKQTRAAPESGAPISPSEAEQDDLIGRPKLPEGLSLMGMDELSFRKEGNDHKEKMLGSVPDLLEEMKELFGILKDEHATKEDFSVLMDGFKPRLQVIRTETNQQSINEFITNHAPFPLSERELEAFWE